MQINDYYDKEVTEGTHRDAVGGMWDEIGKLQFDFLVSQGLRAGMKLLDVGCGSLRGGIHFIRHLNRGDYYGIDVNQSLLDLGYDRELAAVGLREKLPRENLLQDEHFRAYRFSMEFDFALALSVFTHLPLNHIRLCLIELAKCMKKGGRFYTTFFECTPDGPIEESITHEPGGIVTYTDKDPYHYKLCDFQWCIDRLPWNLEYIGEWNHPRAQRMLCFARTADNS